MDKKFILIFLILFSMMKFIYSGNDETEIEIPIPEKPTPPDTDYDTDIEEPIIDFPSGPKETLPKGQYQIEFYLVSGYKYERNSRKITFIMYAKYASQYGKPLINSIYILPLIIENYESGNNRIQALCSQQKGEVQTNETLSFNCEALCPNNDSLAFKVDIDLEKSVDFRVPPIDSRDISFWGNGFVREEHNFICNEISAYRTSSNNTDEKPEENVTITWLAVEEVHFSYLELKNFKMSFTMSAKIIKGYMGCASYSIPLKINQKRPVRNLQEDQEHLKAHCNQNGTEKGYVSFYCIAYLPEDLRDQGLIEEVKLDFDSIEWSKGMEVPVIIKDEMLENSNIAKNYESILRNLIFNDTKMLSMAKVEVRCQSGGNFTLNSIGNISKLFSPLEQRGINNEKVTIGGYNFSCSAQQAKPEEDISVTCYPLNEANTSKVNFNNEHFELRSQNNTILYVRVVDINNICKGDYFYLNAKGSCEKRTSDELKFSGKLESNLTKVIEMKNKEVTLSNENNYTCSAKNTSNINVEITCKIKNNTKAENKIKIDSFSLIENNTNLTVILNEDNNEITCKQIVPQKPKVYFEEIEEFKSENSKITFTMWATLVTGELKNAVYTIILIIEKKFRNVRNLEMESLKAPCVQSISKNSNIGFSCSAPFTEDVSKYKITPGDIEWDDNDNAPTTEKAPNFENMDITKNTGDEFGRNVQNGKNIASISMKGTCNVKDEAILTFTEKASELSSPLIDDIEQTIKIDGHNYNCKTKVPYESSGNLIVTCEYNGKGADDIERVNVNKFYLSDDESTLIVYPTNNLLNCNKDDDDDDGLSGGAIAGIVIGSVVFVAIVVAISIFICKKKSPEKIENVNSQTEQKIASQA